MVPGHLQGWWLHQLSGQPVPSLTQEEERHNHACKHLQKWQDWRQSFGGQRGNKTMARHWHKHWHSTIKPTLRPMRPQANFIPLPWEFLCSLETRKKNTARLVAFKERNLLFKWKKVSTGTWAESQNQKDIIWDAVPNEDLHYWTFFSFLNDPSFTHCQENFLNK